MTGAAFLLAALTALVSSWFVSPEQLEELRAGGAVVLDARESGYFWGHLPTAQPVKWTDFRDGWGRTGRLDPDVSKMARRLALLGVDSRRPVVVYGDAQRGFGEEGRMAWLLAYLGHPQVYILDGGVAAWRQAGKPLVRGFAPKVSAPGQLVVQVNTQLRAQRAEVLAVSTALAADSAKPPSLPLLLDVRSDEEWRGATPYFEARGGRIPGSLHLDWRQLLDAQGRLLPPSQLRALLGRVGVPDGALPPLIVYCTGGVRSAFVWAALRSLGATQVKNYDGSFWEWAADTSLPVARP
ncbi:MAG TPA: rhodanese-like domain-containing protein [Pseudomonadota bacterium]|jgi:thiosulfate/3-mercaptopyruvate sulfurtransferase|nr:sulfurtransferase [Deltaproteobacteria bacterium]HPH27190.1 rhodanese-like domain-containing protein [Pseudomonadota bacterium]